MIFSYLGEKLCDIQDYVFCIYDFKQYNFVY